MNNIPYLLYTFVSKFSGVGQHSILALIQLIELVKLQLYGCKHLPYAVMQVFSQAFSFTFLGVYHRLQQLLLPLIFQAPQSHLVFDHFSLINDNEEKQTGYEYYYYSCADDKYWNYVVFWGRHSRAIENNKLAIILVIF